MLQCFQCCSRGKISKLLSDGSLIVLLLLVLDTNLSEGGLLIGVQTELEERLWK